MQVNNQWMIQGLELYILEPVKDGLGVKYQGRKTEDLLQRKIKINFRRIENDFYEIVPSKELSAGKYGFLFGGDCYVFQVM